MSTRTVCLQCLSIPFLTFSHQLRVCCNALYSHMDVLHSLETRHSLLGYTYKKYMDAGHCPFVPGRVLDEFYHVLQRLRSSNKLPYPHEVLKELRDLCSVRCSAVLCEPKSHNRLTHSLALADAQLRLRVRKRSSFK